MEAAGRHPRAPGLPDRAPELRIFERGDHNSILAENAQAYLEAVAAFLARVRSAEAPM